MIRDIFNEVATELTRQQILKAKGEIKRTAGDMVRDRTLGDLLDALDEQMGGIDYTVHHTKLFEVDTPLYDALMKLATTAIDAATALAEKRPATSASEIMVL